MKSSGQQGKSRPERERGIIKSLFMERSESYEANAEPRKSLRRDRIRW